MRAIKLSWYGNEVFTLFDLFGTAAFSVLGVVAAIGRRLDIFRILIIAFITAVGEERSGIS